MNEWVWEQKFWPLNGPCYSWMREGFLCATCFLASLVTAPLLFKQHPFLWFSWFPHQTNLSVPTSNPPPCPRGPGTRTPSRHAHATLHDSFQKIKIQWDHLTLEFFGSCLLPTETDSHGHTDQFRGPADMWELYQGCFDVLVQTRWYYCSLSIFSWLGKK